MDNQGTVQQDLKQTNLKKTHDASISMKQGKDNEDQGSQMKSQDLENQISNIKNATPTIKKKIDEKSIEILIKEFDFERIKALRLLKKHDGDLKQTIRFVLNN